MSLKLSKNKVLKNSSFFTLFNLKNKTIATDINQIIKSFIKRFDQSDKYFNMKISNNEYVNNVAIEEIIFLSKKATNTALKDFRTSFVEKNIIIAIVIQTIIANSLLENIFKKSIIVLLNIIKYYLCLSNFESFLNLSKY